MKINFREKNNANYHFAMINIEVFSLIHLFCHIIIRLFPLLSSTI